MKLIDFKPYFLNKKFIAQKESGFSGILFTAGILPEVVKISNFRHKFHFPFYGLTIDLTKNKVEEWVKNYEKEGEKIYQFIIKNGLSYFKNYQITYQKEIKKFEKYCRKIILKIPLAKKDEIIHLFNEFISNYFYSYAFGALTFLYSSILSEKLVQSLSQRYQGAGEFIGFLIKTRYKSFIVKSEKLLLAIKNEKRKDKKKKLIQSYLKKFFFIKTNYENSQILSNSDVLKLAQKTSEIKQKLQKRHSFYFKKIKLTKSEKILIDLFKITEPITDQRKFVNLMGSYILFRFLERAIKLTKIPKNLAQRIFWFEFKNLIFEPEKIKERLRKRKNASVIFDGKNVYYSEKILLEDKPIQIHNILKGTPASPGRLRGRTRIIFGPRDFKKFKEKEILVTPATRPEFVSILNKALAIITDEGGLTSHAAIVSRELKIPCIVGTKIATKVLKDGDLVEVDANKGVVRIIK